MTLENTTFEEDILHLTQLEKEIAELWAQLRARYAKPERLDPELTGPLLAFMRENWAQKQLGKI
jgi:hypothetical protein